jgi:hypothetical protein
MPAFLASIKIAQLILFEIVNKKSIRILKNDANLIIVDKTNMLPFSELYVVCL